jgi:hypothetical protein
LSGSTATITQFDTNGSPVRVLSGIGSNPTGLEVDPKGNVYVAMNGANQVWRFKPTSNSFLPDATFGTNGKGYIGLANGAAGTLPGQFNAPFGVAVAAGGGLLSVTDSGNRRIQQFSDGGVLNNPFGGFGGVQELFHTPKGIAYDRGNSWYAVDSGNNRVYQGRNDYQSGASGTNGSALGEFNGPVHLSVGIRGIYVADTGNNRIQGFDPARNGEGGAFVLDPSTLHIAISTGLNHPSSVAAVDNPTNEMFYVADTGNNRVVLYAIPADNPAAVWDQMIARLKAGDVMGAVSCFSMATAENYQHDFLAIGAPDLLESMEKIGKLTPVSIYEDRAQYYFVRDIQGTKITFPVDFDLENGIWKIKSF